MPLEVVPVRKCRRCGVTKPTKAFAYSGYGARGKRWLARTCRACYHRATYPRVVGQARARALVITDKGRADLRAWEAEHAA